MAVIPRYILHLSHLFACDVTGSCRVDLADAYKRKLVQLFIDAYKLPLIGDLKSALDAHAEDAGESMYLRTSCRGAPDVF